MPFEYVPRAVVNRDIRGFVKIVTDAETRRIVGIRSQDDSASANAQPGYSADCGSLKHCRLSTKKANSPCWLHGVIHAQH
ncbi:hypothetical protein [Cryobacterium mannosilyticum]|uniref:hypothetical protein n=1 Tax=Cryobacterium mannosilyticum TaxID=1259190 RepID=UPI003B9703B2